VEIVVDVKKTEIHTSKKWVKFSTAHEHQKIFKNRNFQLAKTSPKVSDSIPENKRTTIRQQAYIRHSFGMIFSFFFQNCTLTKP
jgi:hypothetical protein